MIRTLALAAILALAAAPAMAVSFCHMPQHPGAYAQIGSGIKEEFENGRDYYALHGAAITPPSRTEHRPDTAVLQWHNEQRFRG